ncbi:MAG: hypothetical protein V7K92_12240 [Nostoc sp.]|uniref:hypothetical protein n=1 Tax=Nostoc sp. TaxID=1180 RepID=UPI002FF3D969
MNVDKGGGLRQGSETQQMPQKVGFRSQPNLRNIFYVSLTQAYWMAESVKLEAPPVREVSGVGTSH